MNPFGSILSCFLKFFVIIFLLCFSYTTYINSVDVLNSLAVFFIFGLILLVIYLISRKINQNELKYSSDELNLLLELTTKEAIQNREDKKNEWSLSSTLLRIVTYFFSMFFIILSFWFIYLGEFIGIMIVLPLTYLYYDIKILLRKNKTK